LKASKAVLAAIEAEDDPAVLQDWENKFQERISKEASLSVEINLAAWGDLSTFNAAATAVP
jgi:hypothetical protein